MSYPRTGTITIDRHDESTPPMSWRFVEIDGTSYHIAKEVCELIGLKAEDDGDYRLTLEGHGVDFLMSMVSDRGTVLGPLALIADEDYRRLAKVVRPSSAGRAM
ncbi:hypothetical protein IB276_20000 [Ensifer sp. ENS04]|uniref:hypothetical protein n=1 Tax=Ensifer sp. ENS04 TaxID=2769281 RepID=UPI0017805B7C|nr:hypothetical protein [Ensifer sp. ENS04]MBD9541731.1 hypothetical protein [Ensifer sp. ENS04]